jgi:hypothetical protein
MRLLDSTTILTLRLGDSSAIHLHHLIMHSTIALLPILAFAAGVLAAPMPPRLNARGRPNLHEVIRNPTPINACADIQAVDKLLGGILNFGCEGGTHRRAAPVLKEEAAPVVVIDRST